MPDLTITFTLSPAMIGAALVYDAALLWLGLTVYRRLRQGQRRPAAFPG
jgi:hypothetical protein